MTLIDVAVASCPVCGTLNEFGALASTSSFGSPDLDLRPPELSRSSMRAWVHECSDCGYVSGDISWITEGAPEIVRSDRYQDLRKNSDIPALARRFLLQSKLLEPASVEAAMAVLHAAWVFDDLGDEPSAAALRSECALIMEQAMAGLATEERISRQIQLVDVLRRSGQMSRAADLAQQLRQTPKLERTMDSILVFQIERCRQTDTGAYTIADACAQG